MKKLKALELSIISFFAFMLSMSAIAFAAEPVYVYINNELVQYEDATPQIMNNRAMVPFRLTAEKLGATIDWNSKTEVMTLTKGTRTVVHKLRSNVVTVNGEAAVFDTSSAVLQDRTMMPVRMLAEALGSQVDWDSSTRSVIIKSDEPTVTTAYFSENVITSGSEATLSVVANTSTEKVKAVDVTTGSILGESFNYTDNSGGGRLFVIKWSPSVDTSLYKTVQVYAGNGTSYNESQSITVGVNVTVDNKPKISSVKADDNTVDKNDYVTLTVLANQATDRIKVTNDFKSGSNEFTTFTEKGNQREFTAKVRMTVKGECTLSVYAGNADGYTSEYQTVSIDVDTSKNRDDDDDDDDEELKIIDIEVLNDNIAVDEEAEVNIITSTDITQVKVFDEDDKQIVKKNFHTSKDGDELTWRVQIEVKDSGRNRYTVYAYNEDEDYDSDSFSISGENYSNNRIYIVNITSKSGDLAYGDTGKFTVKTTSVGEKIIVKDYKGNQIAEVTSPNSSSGGYRTFDFSVKLDNRNYDYFTVYAYDDEDNVDSKKYYVDMDVEEEPEIIDVKIEEKTVDEGDDIEITVYTNDAVTRVWVEDEDDRRVANKKKYDEKDGDEYIWEISFEAEDEGRISYTVFAENEDGEEDEYSFSIKVK